MTTLRERQIALETESIQKGLDRYTEQASKLVQSGQAGSTDWGNAVLRTAVAPMVEALEDLLELSKATAGRRHALVPLLEQLPIPLVAYITARSVIDDTFGPSSRTLTPASNHIADRLMTEAQAREFKGIESKLFNTVENRLDRNPLGSDPKVRASTLRHAAKKFHVPITTWSTATKIAVGRNLLELFIESTGLVTIERGRRGRLTTESLEPSEALVKFVENYKDRTELLHPFLQPMITPPRPWETIDSGGYLEMKTTYPGIVKNRTKAHLEELRRADLSRVFSAVNHLQNTAWRVNTWLLKHVEKAMELGLAVGDTLIGKDWEYTGRPSFPEDSPEYKQWKREAAEGFRKNRRNAGRRVLQFKTLQVASTFAEESAIYFPYQLDFRGRVYAVPSFLNPQGNDLAKGLLEFADGKPLGTDGASWLYVHIANTFGVDKVSYKERVQWVGENQERIVNTAKDPFSDLWWVDADSPWQFLAAAKSLANYIEQGESYVCHTPVSVDGSNNGLQHFSAMLRDKSCGASVNLVPQETPADIYSAVAKSVNTLLKQREFTDDMARLWLIFGVDRSLCKRPVMIVPYGGTRDGIRGYVIEAIDERDGHPFQPGQVGEAATYLAKIIEEAMDELMPGPRQAMKWLQDAAKAVAALNRPVTWTTPNGFIAQQAYFDPKMEKINCFVLGRRVQVMLRTGDKSTVNRQKQVQSFSPNYVHSLDASALTETVNEATKRGLTHFACVHDSYGTHACDMTVLQQTLREVFVQQYSGDVLKDLKDQLDPLLDAPLPDPPPQGDLDITQVLDSEYFFA